VRALLATNGAPARCAFLRTHTVNRRPKLTPDRRRKLTPFSPGPSLDVEAQAPITKGVA
jgi:hypothetical protein